jgi:hypothetical protein
MDICTVGTIATVTYKLNVPFRIQILFLLAWGFLALLLGGTASHTNLPTQCFLPATHERLVL